VAGVKVNWHGSHEGLEKGEGGGGKTLLYLIPSGRCSQIEWHWGIENQLHWRLDVVFNEDKGCIRNDNAPENMDILRKWALNILHKAKEKPEQSIKSVMRKNAMSIKHLLTCVKKILHA
jgi:hypothetical protein